MSIETWRTPESQPTLKTQIDSLKTEISAELNKERKIAEINLFIDKLMANNSDPSLFISEILKSEYGNLFYELVVTYKKSNESEKIKYLFTKSIWWRLVLVNFCWDKNLENLITAYDIFAESSYLEKGWILYEKRWESYYSPEWNRLLIFEWDQIAYFDKKVHIVRSWENLWRIVLDATKNQALAQKANWITIYPWDIVYIWKEWFTLRRWNERNLVYLNEDSQENSWNWSTNVETTPQEAPATPRIEQPSITTTTVERVEYEDYTIQPWDLISLIYDRKVAPLWIMTRQEFYEKVKNDDNGISEPWKIRPWQVIKIPKWKVVEEVEVQEKPKEEFEYFTVISKHPWNTLLWIYNSVEWLKEVYPSPEEFIKWVVENNGLKSPRHIYPWQKLKLYKLPEEQPVVWNEWQRQTLSEEKPAIIWVEDQTSAPQEELVWGLHDNGWEARSAEEQIAPWIEKQTQSPSEELVWGLHDDTDDMDLSIETKYINLVRDFFKWNDINEDNIYIDEINSIPLEKIAMIFFANNEEQADYHAVLMSEWWTDVVIALRRRIKKAIIFSQLFPEKVNILENNVDFSADTFTFEYFDYLRKQTNDFQKSLPNVYEYLLGKDSWISYEEFIEKVKYFLYTFLMENSSSKIWWLYMYQKFFLIEDNDSQYVNLPIGSEETDLTSRVGLLNILNENDYKDKDKDKVKIINKFLAWLKYNYQIDFIVSNINSIIDFNVDSQETIGVKLTSIIASLSKLSVLDWNIVVENSKELFEYAKKHNLSIEETIKKCKETLDFINANYKWENFDVFKISLMESIWAFMFLKDQFGKFNFKSFTLRDVSALIFFESEFNPRAKSPTWSVGIMQTTSTIVDDMQERPNNYNQDMIDYLLKSNWITSLSQLTIELRKKTENSIILWLLYLDSLERNWYRLWKVRKNLNYIHRNRDNFYDIVSERLKRKWISNFSREQFNAIVDRMILWWDDIKVMFDVLMWYNWDENRYPQEILDDKGNVIKTSNEIVSHRIYYATAIICISELLKMSANK